MAFFRSGILVSGSAGFLGSHLCAALEKNSEAEFASVDVCDVSSMAALATRWRPDVIVHLASRGTVLTPLDRVPEMLDVAVDGLLHLLRVFMPRKVILPSSCAVYGDTRMLAVSPSAPPNPMSIYGLGKILSERILQQWAEETRNTAVIFRIGNLVGRGSRGLVGYLTNHALRYPEGNPPAEMRGAGRMVRDYVPIDYAVRIFQQAISEEWQPGQICVLNLGSGRPRTNQQVAGVVQETLAESGIALKIHYQDEPAGGEAPTIVLDSQETVRRLGIDPPSEAEVTQAIREAVLSRRDKLQSAKSASA
jgi:nucleoside-diphosphate-sugar epimerase